MSYKSIHLQPSLKVKWVESNLSHIKKNYIFFQSSQLEPVVSQVGSWVRVHFDTLTSINFVVIYVYMYDRKGFWIERQ